MPAAIKCFIWLLALFCFVYDCLREAGRLEGRKGHFWMSLGWALFIFPFMWDAGVAAFD